MLVTSRCLAEYRAMFDLDDGDLDGGVLDCCAGASSFVAELADRDRFGLAADPAYALPRRQLAEAVSASRSGGSHIIEAHEDRFVWDWYGTPERREELRGRAAGRFLDDIGRSPSRYVASALPRLALADSSFDLVICSHLLFTWSDDLGFGWHLAALREMIRVARREVRVFPLVVQGTGEPVPFLADICERLARDGLEVHRRRVAYEFQRGADTMLAVRGAPAASVPAGS